MDSRNDIPLARLMLDAFNWFDRSLLTSLQARELPELSQAQSRLMAEVSDEGMRISELARCIGISRQAAQKSVMELERQGLLYTVADPENKSAKLVKLTEQGDYLIEQALAIFAELEQQLSKEIGEDGLQTLRRLLNRNWRNVSIQR